MGNHTELGATGPVKVECEALGLQGLAKLQDYQSSAQPSGDVAVTSCPCRNSRLKPLGFGSQFKRMQFIMVKNSWQQELQAAGHVCLRIGSQAAMVKLSRSRVSADREQR